MIQSLQSTHPELIKEWDFDKNNQNKIYPSKMTYGSGVKVFWKCEAKSHSWEMKIVSRTRNKYNCPECKKTRLGSLAEKYPHVLESWDYDKNTVDPSDIASHSRVECFWKCENNHEWKTAVNKVINREIPCTICSKVKNGSLLTLFPKVAAGLHPDKNNGADPQWIAPSSNVRMNWICPNKHEWEAPVNRVTRNNLGCPSCPRASKNTKHPIVLESDFAHFWDTEKNNQEDINGNKLRLGSNIKAHWKCDKGHAWFMRISHFASQKKECQECLIGTSTPGGYTRHPKLSIGNPQVASEWHPTRNKDLTPENVSTASGKSVWWLCESGHEWENVISNRTINKQNCNMCKNIESGSVFDSSKINEWDFEKNTINPKDVSIYNSRVKFWWICKNNHEWKSTPSTRIISDHSCPQCNYLKNGTLFDKFPELLQQWSDKNDLSPDDYSYGSHQKVFWKCDKGHTWNASIGNRTGNRQSGCPKCIPPYSLAEKELAEFIKGSGFEIEENKRGLVPGRSKLECDIFIPSLNIGIEFNGLYWHSEEMGKGRNYHKEKMEAFNDEDIRLIQVWEDDWRDRRDIVQSGLLHRLGKSNKDRFPARRTVAETINAKIAQDFLNTYHIQGFANGTVYFALFEKDVLFAEPIAVMVFTIRGKDAYLDRFATSKIISGGFSKLLKAAESYLRGLGNIETLVTFADQSLSEGDLYSRTGWTVDKILKPDYMYVVDGERKHKFGYRLKRFRNDPELQYIDGYTESQLARLNNIPRVWDSGKIRYIKQL